MQLIDKKFALINFWAGRIVKNEQEKYVSEFMITDDLGNTVVTFTDKDGDGLAIDRLGNVNSDVIQRELYYPFGLQLRGTNPVVPNEQQNYLYNGKEQMEGTGLYNYGARYYDPAVARWHGVDPNAQKYEPWSSYAYAYNNPLMFVDPDGRDNIIYLIVLQGAGKRINPQGLVNHLNGMMQSLGLDIQAKIFDHTSAADFDAANLDPTDNFIVLGSNPDQVAEYIIDKTGFESGDLFGYTYTYRNKPGKAIVELGQANAIAVNEHNIDLAKYYLGGPSEKTTAFLSLHAYGHNMGEITHAASDKFDTGFMSPGATLQHSGSIDNIMSSLSNSVPVERLQSVLERPAPIGPLPGGSCLNGKCAISPQDNYLQNAALRQSDND